MHLRRTKIVCTLGPAVDSVEGIRGLIEAGMDVARVNFSHGTHQQHERTIALIREAARLTGKRIVILQDLSGPKLRIGKFAAGKVLLQKGAPFVLTARPASGDEREVSLGCPEIIADLKPGDRLLLGDGEIELRVEQTSATEVQTEVVFGGELRSNKGLNAPGVRLGLAVPTPKDFDDLRFGLAQGVEWVAQSFVRSAAELRALRAFLNERNADVSVIAKIEKREALDDLEQIVAEADGVMVARGDLGLELPLPELPAAQKKIIQAAGAAGKPEITATQMLESMIENPRPTRAEVTDVANAVYDGTDALMLSGETAVGRHPFEATRMLGDIAVGAEQTVDYSRTQRRYDHAESGERSDAVAQAACCLAASLGAKLILCCTRSGLTARLIAKYRPQAVIAVASPNERALNKAALLWGAYPLLVPETDKTEQIVRQAQAEVVRMGLAVPGTPIIIVTGEPGAGVNAIKTTVL
jgi:pyruvate kinase